MRLVSLVPSVTETIATFGGADALVAVTDYCVVGAPDHAARIGGTKNPSIARIAALRPDLVIANQEENRKEDVEALRAAGIEVLVTFPRTVADVPPLLQQLAEVISVPAAAEPYVRAINEVLATPTPQPKLRALTFIWRKPWMALAPGTYADDLLRLCGFANVLTDASSPYPTLTSPPEVSPDVVFLPTEPYEFTEADLPAVADFLSGGSSGAGSGSRPGPRLQMVDGQLLTWHGPRTAQALSHFRTLRATLS